MFARSNTFPLTETMRAATSGSMRPFVRCPVAVNHLLDARPFPFGDVDEEDVGRVRRRGAGDLTQQGSLNQVTRLTWNITPVPKATRTEVA